jgi:hypothetical protein
MAQIAHISYAGGGLIIPARSPYDRQEMVAHVLGTARSKQKVMVTVGRGTWNLRPADQNSPALCKHCERPINSVVCEPLTQGHKTMFCVVCAFGKG